MVVPGHRDSVDAVERTKCAVARDLMLAKLPQRAVAGVDVVDVRMVFGAETDERFDWTRFYPLTLSSMDQCKDGAWEGFGFKNQGQCIASIVANDNSVH